MQSCIGTHEALRRLGFQAKDIFVGTVGGKAFVFLRVQGKEFVIANGPYDGTQEEFGALWEKVALAVNSHQVSSDDFDHMYFNCAAMEFGGVEFMMALTNKGIRLPDRKQAQKQAVADLN